MPRLFTLVVGAAASAAAAVASATTTFADQCSAVTNPAPCGQSNDPQDICLAKGCCYNAAFSKAPCFYPGYNAVNITKVMVIQASHFDAGFADTTVNILNRWFTQHIPRCYTIGAALEAMDGPWGLKFTMQSWIASLYTDCPPNAGLQCPTAEELANFTTAVKKQWITWHAFPFNAELELYEPDMISFGINVTRGLDVQFAAQPKRVLSQRDVPGTTRSAIPILLANGVQAVTVGVNSASTPPKVPRAFNWCDPESSQCMLAMWHPFGYGGIGFDDAVILPHLSTAAVFDWRGDNAGPYDNTGEALSDWSSLNGTFPGATIVASTLEDWLAEASTVTSMLPTLTQEIADTWIHGAASDPQKGAWFKTGQTLRSACIASGECDVNDYAFRNFSRFYLKNGEHTWGKDIKTYLHDTTHWSNADLQAAYNLSNFQDIMASWDEQRAYGFTYALGALPETHPLRVALEASMAAIVPPPQPSPGAPMWTPLPGGASVTAGRWTFALDGATCGIASLVDGTTGQVWANADAGELLAWVEYHTYDVDDYNAFLTNYSSMTPVPSYFPLDFGKPNMTIASPVHQELRASCSGAWSAVDAAATHVLAHLTIVNANGSEPHERYGAPGDMWLALDASNDAADARINLTLALYNKTSTRLPEALYVRFNASGLFGANASAPRTAVQWNADKLGEWVDPYNVAIGGNQHHHAVRSGLMATKRDPAGAAPNATLTVTSPDVNLVVFGHPFGLPTPHNVTPARSEGAGFYLLDNLWGTNYPMWSPWRPEDADIQFHFSLTSGTA